MTDTLHRSRVLVVDDDALDRLAVRRALPTGLVEVDEADTFETALEKLTSQRYDVALVDYCLPPTSGSELLARMKEDQIAVPVILLSGQGSEEIVAEVMKAGAVDYLPKALVREPHRLWHAVTLALEVNRLKKETQRVQSHFRIAMEGAGAGTWNWHFDRQTLEGDSRCAELLGLPPGPFELREGEFLAYMVAEDRPAVEAFLRVLPDTSTEAQPVAVQFRVALAGTTRWLDLRGRCESATPTSAVKSCFGIALNITVQREAERAAAELRERLMGIVSHDLKNPLNAILQATALLAGSGELTEKYLRFVGHIRDSAERMSNIVVQLLDLTRARAGQGLALRYQRFDLATVLAQVTDELRLSHSDRSIGVCGGQLEMFGDPDRLAQVASNLLANALSHGAHDASVELAFGASAHEVEITVRNRGEPIAPPLLPLLFEPFFRAQGGASREGLGLGLFIAKELVVAHHGRINVSSTAEDGTRFSVAVPRWPQTVRPARPVGEP